MSFTSSCLLKPFDVNSELGLQIQEAIGPNIGGLKRGKVKYNEAIQHAVEALGLEAKPEEYAAFARAQSTPYTIFHGKDLTYMVDPVTNKKWEIRPIENSDNVEYEEVTFYNDPLNAIPDFTKAEAAAFTNGKIGLFQTASETRQKSLNDALDKSRFDSLPKRIQSLKAVENRQARIGNIAHTMSSKIDDAIENLVNSINQDAALVSNDNYDDELFAKYNIKKMLNEPNNVNKTRLLEAIFNRKKEFEQSRAKAIQQIGIESIINNTRQYYINRITGDDEEMVSDEAVNKIKTMLNYFDILVPEALEVLKDIEGVTVNIVEGTIEDVEDEAIENLYESQLEDEYGMSEEEIARQTYGQFGTSSIRSGASTRLKMLLSTIEYFDPADGLTYIDDIEEPVYIDGNRAFAELLNICNDLTDASELLPRLYKEAQTRPWLETVALMVENSINSEEGPLEKYDNFFADLWYTMRKDQAVFSKVESSTEYGIVHNKVRNINQVEGAKAMNDAWNANIDSLFSSVKKTQNFPKDLFDSELNMNEDVYNSVAKFFKENRSKADILAHLDDFKAIMSMIGIPIVHDNLVDECLNGISKAEAEKLIVNIKGVFDNIKKLGLKKILDNNTVFKDFEQKNIKNILSSIVPLNVESSIRYAGKSYYGHVYPNFIQKFSKIADSDDTRRTIKFLYVEYGRFPQYAKILSPISLEDIEKMPGKELFSKIEFNNVILQDIWKNACEGKASDIRLKNVVGRDETEYYKMSAVDIAITGISEYYADDKEYCQMVCPIESDKPCMNTMRWKKSEYRKQNIIRDRKTGHRLSNRSLEQIANSLIQEAKRIRMVKERAATFLDAIKKNKPVPFEPIENYDAVFFDDKSKKWLFDNNASGLRFCLNATYNGIVLEEDGKDISLEDYILEHENDEKLSFYKDLADIVIIPQLREDYDKCFKDWEEIGLFSTKIKTSFDGKEKLVFTNFSGFSQLAECESLAELKEELFLYFMDYTAFTTAVTNILTSDLAFYKNNNYVDAQKRAGEWHAPGQRVNTAILKNIKTTQIDRSKTKRASLAESGKVVFKKVDRYPVDKYGHIQQREIILKDIKRLAPSAGNMIAALTEKFAGDPEAVEKIKNIIDGHDGINTADAQAYRSIDSYLDFLKAKGDPNYKACALAIQRIQDGHSTKEDLDIVMQTFKPFNYGLREVKDPVTGTIFPAPIQCKNSEFPILLAIFSKTCKNSVDSLPMRVLDQFMRDNNIHVLQFESAIKASNQGGIDVESFFSVSQDVINTAKDTRRNKLYEQLENEIYDEKGNEKHDIIKYLNIEDWGIQGEQPEHIINHTQLRGSQIQKLITVNHPADAIFNVNGEQLSEQEWQEVYNKVLSAQYKGALDKLSEIFGSKQKFSNELKRMISNSTRYSDNMKSAVEIDPETNDFSVDFDDPAISSDIQMLLLSFMNKKLNRMECKGGSCIQVSDFGYSEQLHLVFEDANSNEIMLDPNDMPADMNSYLAQHPGIRVKYMECYLPVYDKRLYDKLVTYHYNENGDIINTTLELYDSEGNPKIPEDLLKAIGYRVPTESYYSMMPLRIKGFLPQQNGSSIMLPAEIVSLSGTDFDIDHMYLMLPNFDVNDLRYRMAAKSLKTKDKELKDQLKLVLQRNPEIRNIGTLSEYAKYVKSIYPSSVDKNIYWHGSDSDFSEGFKSALRGEGSGALETKDRNDFYLAKQAWTVLQYVSGVNRNSVDKNGFKHWNKLWWELKEIMSNGRRENNNWKDLVINEENVRQAIPNKKGVFNRDQGGENGKWLSERKADYGYEEKTDREFFEDILGIKWREDTFNTWVVRNAEIFKSLQETEKGIYPAIINTKNPIKESGQNTYYEADRGLFSKAEKEGNDAILSRNADNEFSSDVAVVLNNNNNVHFLGTQEDLKNFKAWLEENRDKLVEEKRLDEEVYNAIQNLKHKEKFEIVAGQKSGTPTAMTESDEEVVERVMKKWKRNENPLLLTPNEAKIVEWFAQTQEDANGNSVYGDTEVLEYKKYQYKDANGNLTNPNDFDKETQDNAILELMYGVLTSHDMIDQFLKPGGFDETKKTSRIAFLLTKGAEVVNPMIAEKFKDATIYPNLYDTLNALSLKQIKKIEESMQETVNPTSPSTYMKFHQQNMVGKQMLAIFAVALSAHGLWQHNNARIITDIHPLFGYSPTEVDGIYDRTGSFIAHNLAVGVAGSADNVKDPTLARMGLNKMTINTAINMLRMGYTYDDVAIMLNQPIMRYLSNNFFANGAKGSLLGEITKLKRGLDGGELDEASQIGLLNYDTLVNEMSIEADIEHVTPTQMDVLNWFYSFEKKFSNDMRKYTDESKPEKSFKTTIGATVDTFNEAYQDLAPARINNNNEQSKEPSIEYESKINSQDNDGSDVVATRQSVTADSIRILKDSGAFPVTFHIVTRNIRAILKDSYGLIGEDLENAMRDWSSFLRQSSSVYIQNTFPVKLDGKEYGPKPESEEYLEVAYEKTKQYYQKEFPTVFEKFKKKYPFGTFKILDILSVNKRGKFKIINATSRRAKGYLETEISNSWLYMATCGDQVAENFAKQLFVYCAFRGQYSSFNNGFANYGSALLSLIDTTDFNIINVLDSSEGKNLASRFLFQFFNNHQELLSKKATPIYAFKKNDKRGESGSGLYAKSTKNMPVVIDLNKESIEKYTTNTGKRATFGNIARSSKTKYIKLIGINKVEDPIAGKTNEVPYEHIYMRIGDSRKFVLLPRAGSDVLNEYNPYSDGYVGCLSSGIYSDEVLEELFRINNFAVPLREYASVKNEEQDDAEDVEPIEGLSQQAKADTNNLLLEDNQAVSQRPSNIMPDNITEEYVEGLSDDEAQELYNSLFDQLVSADKRKLCNLASSIKTAMGRIRKVKPSVVPF